jgi:predicted nuclease with TOPRIM domain
MSRWITIEAAELAVKALEERIKALEAEKARLKDEVELLTKVGDKLSNKLWMNCDFADCEETCVAWDDAKRGKDTL